MIKVDALTRTYGKVVAVDNVSFEIGPREIVGLLGHNGAGKTTVLKILTGFLEPSAGNVTINNLNVCDDRQQIQNIIGYLPENSPLYPDMTAIDYLNYAASLRGVPEDKRQERIIYAIQKTRIVDVAMKPVNTLSRGYKQRLGVAQAILNSPGILILDEPTNGLDPTQILEMRSLIRELAETATIIISTHILQEVQALCGRVIIINKGRLALDAKLDALQVSNKLALAVDKEIDNIPGVLQDLSLKVIDLQKKPDHFRYTLEAQSNNVHDLTPTVVQRLVNAGCKIFAVHPIERDLEVIFREISSGNVIVAKDKLKSAPGSAGPAVSSTHPPTAKKAIENEEQNGSEDLSVTPEPDQLSAVPAAGKGDNSSNETP